MRKIFEEQVEIARIERESKPLIAEPISQEEVSKLFGKKLLEVKLDRQETQEFFDGCALTVAETESVIAKQESSEAALPIARVFVTNFESFDTRTLKTVMDLLACELDRRELWNQLNNGGLRAADLRKELD
jgi:hypothetical protein